jgi:hypothetical protein
MELSQGQSFHMHNAGTRIEVERATRKNGNGDINLANNRSFVSKHVRQPGIKKRRQFSRKGLITPFGA